MAALPIDDTVRSIAVSVVWVSCAPGAPGVTQRTTNYLDSYLQIVGSERIDQAAAGLMATTDAALDRRNAALDEYFASLMAGMCKPPIKAGNEGLCESVKRAADKPR